MPVVADRLKYFPAELATGLAEVAIGNPNPPPGATSSPRGGPKSYIHSRPSDRTVSPTRLFAETLIKKLVLFEGIHIVKGKICHL